MRAFEFHIPVIGYGDNLDEAFDKAISCLILDSDEAVRGDIKYREITDDDYAEELVRAMEVTGLSLPSSGEA
tara:strand:+ start:235 stop:450 length:216 start_codon:yes stop_codon:yes gene_type:complete